MRRFWLVLLPIAVLSFSVLVLSAWLGVRAFEARNHLNEARRELLAIESALRQGRLQPGDSAVTRAVSVAGRSTQVARRLTSDRLWRVAAKVPIAGCPLRSSAELTISADELTREVAQPLAALAPVLNPRRGASGFVINVSGLREAAGDVGRITDRLETLRSKVATSRGCSVVGAAVGLPSARGELYARIQRIADAAADLRVGTQLLPSMLGADGPRRYLLVVQNEAQSRATGGIISGHGYLHARSGRLSLDTRNSGGLPSFGSAPVLRLGPSFEARYARLRAASVWGNANLTPDYPMAARIFAAMWARGTGQQVDGVVTIDPTMLGYLLSQVGSARMPDGQQVSGEGLVTLLQSRIYSMVPDGEQRDRYFAGAGKAIYQKLLSSETSPVRLLPPMGRAADEGRLLIWSRHPAEQQALGRTPLGGVLPTAGGPFLAVVNQNGTGSKLDYWLRRSTDYRLRRLPDGTAEATVTVRFRNTAPTSGLPLYVRQRLDGAASGPMPPGQTVLYTSVYGGVGAGFTAATLDDKAVRLESELEKGHGVFSTFITANPGQTRTLRVVISEPKWQPYVTVRPQPLVHPEVLRITGAKRRATSVLISP